MIQTHGYGVLKSSFFQSRVIFLLATLLCLIVGAGSVSSVLVVLQKANNVVVRCHLCWVPFLRDGIFDRQERPFCNAVSKGAINVRCL